MQKRWLWTELGCNSDVMSSVKSSQRIKGILVDSNGEGVECGSRVRSRVKVMCSIRSMGEIGVQLEIGATPNVRVSARIRLRLKVK